MTVGRINEGMTRLLVFKAPAGEVGEWLTSMNAVEAEPGQDEYILEVLENNRDTVAALTALAKLNLIKFLGFKERDTTRSASVGPVYKSMNEDSMRMLVFKVPGGEIGEWLCSMDNIEAVPSDGGYTVHVPENNSIAAGILSGLAKANMVKFVGNKEKDMTGRARTMARESLVSRNPASKLDESDLTSVLKLAGLSKKSR